MGTITSANSVLMIGVAGLFGTAQQLQGFGADDAYSMPEVETSEVVMGVDGIASSGYVPQLKTMNVVLQADSASIDFFESWYAAQEAAQEAFLAFGTLLQPSISRAYALSVGSLFGYKPVADAKKILQPRPFSIKWQVVLGAPA